MLRILTTVRAHGPPKKNGAEAAAAVTPKAMEQVGNDNQAADATVPKAKKRPRDKQAASSAHGEATVEEGPSGNVEEAAAEVEAEKETAAEACVEEEEEEEEE
jgi:hypothetical protein